MIPSLNYMGGAAAPTRYRPQFDHAPARKAWALENEVIEPVRHAVAIVMGPRFPVEYIEADIIRSVAGCYEETHDGAAAAKLYLEKIGPRASAVLRVIRRNFERHPERWGVA